jgi:hypothetical protein
MALVRMREAPQLVDAHEARHRHDHDRAERGLRQVLKQPREEQAGEDYQRGGHDRGELALSAGARGRRRLARAARLHEALREAGEQVRSAERDEVTIDVDLVAALRRQRPRHADPLGAEQQHADRGADEVGEVVGVDVGDRQLRGRRRDVADDVDPVIGELQKRRDDDAEDQHDQRARERGPARAADHQPRDARGGDRDGGAVHVADVVEQIAELMKERAARAFDAEQLGGLPDRDGQAEAEQEPGHHRLGDQVGQRAQPQHAGEHKHRGGDERQRRRERGEAAGIAIGERADRRCGHRGRCRRRADHERARRAQQRVGNQCSRRGHQARLGWQAGDLGVGDRLRDDDAPDHDAGDDVGAQPRAAVMPEPGGHPQYA